MNKKIILASKSPRRKALLELMGLSFEIKAGLWSELSQEELNFTPQELCCYNALGKARAINIPPCEDCLVIGCDTIVVLNKKILGKPGNNEKAIEMLSLLSGKTHIVYSGLSLIDNKTKKEVTEYVKTTVKFKRLTLKEIKNYVRTGEPIDKAGAYGIQGKGALLVEKINGCYYNVVGLPLTKLYEMLLELGIDFWDVIK